MSQNTIYNNEASPLYVKSKLFAERIIKMVRYIKREREKEFSPLHNQVLRSGTSIYANVSESQFAQTPADFITKLHISLKEANETKSWLHMLFSGGSITQQEHDSMLSDLSEIIAILVSSIKTIKKTSGLGK